MKEPVEYTGPAATRTVRSRKVYPGFAPQAPLLQKRFGEERTSQIFHTAAELETGPLKPENNTETIIFQSDPALRVKLAKLHQAKKEVQTEIKALRQKISKREYARVVLRYTVMTRGWVAVKPTRYEYKPTPAQYTWTKHYRRKELLSEEEWLKRKLQLTTLRVRQRRSYKSRLQLWLAHPDWERKPYRYWYSEPYWIRTVVVPEGAGGSMRVPVKEFKYYPRRRWDLIRTDWLHRLNSIRPRMDKLQRRFDQIKQRLAELYYHTEYKPMVYTQRCEWVPLNRKPIGKIHLEVLGMPHQQSELPNEKIYPGGLPFGIFRRSSLVRQTQYTFESVDSRHQTTSPPGRVTLVTKARDIAAFGPAAVHTVVQGRWDDGWYWDIVGGLHKTLRKETETNRTIVLDDVSDLEQQLQDKLQAARLALLNLRLGRDVVEFNPFRSLLEQKDIPSTFQSGRDFFRFARNAPGLEYWEVTTSSGSRTVFTTSVMSSAQRAVLSGTRKPSDAALRAVGLKRAVRRVATKRSGLATIAGLYLAYKFAIAPTRADIETTLEKGWDYVLTCRRGLDQLIRKHGLHFWENRSLYRTFRVGDQAMLSQHSNTQVFDLNIPVTWQREYHWSLTVPMGDWYHWLKGEYPPTVKPIRTGFVYETTGDVHLWFPAVHATAECLTSEYFKEIEDHNIDELWSLVPEEYQGSLTYVRQILRGKVFAQFRAKELMKGLGDGGIRSHIAWANLYKTAWDLLPCSFVLEWFTNLGEVATATNDLANAMISGLNVSKKTWASLSSSVFANAPVVPVVEASISAIPQRYTRIWVPSEPGSNYAYYVYDFMSEAQGTVRLNAALPQTARQLRNTAIRTSVRRVIHTAVDTPKVRLRVSITPPQAGSLAAMLLSGG